jgi:hypothetical protein
VFIISMDKQRFTRRQKEGICKLLSFW